MFTIADWAWNSKKLHEHDPKMWYVSSSSLININHPETDKDYRDDLVDNFSGHQDEVNKILAEGVKKLQV